MWSHAIHLSETTDAIVLDQQALNNSDIPDEINKRILQLCLILASQFVLNTVGHVSDQTFDSLTPFLQAQIMAQDVQLNWVLRDFSLEFKTLTPKSYLSQCLETQRSVNAEQTARNQVKTFFQQSFSSINCFALPIPTEQDVTLLDTDQCQLNPEFES